MNKHIERSHLIEAISQTSEFPNGVLNSDDRESPDFILFSDIIIGIELTSFIRGINKDHREHNRATEKARNRVMVESKKVFDSLNKAPLQVIFQWQINGRIPDKQILLIADNIAALIHKYVGKSLENTIALRYDELEPFDLEKYLFSIYIKPTVSSSIWCPVNAAFIEPGVDEIQQIIDSKNKKVTDYLKECDECYLLIVADGNSFSSLCNLNHKVLTHKFQSNFNKILFYNRDPFRVEQKNIFKLNHTS